MKSRLNEKRLPRDLGKTSNNMPASFAKKKSRTIHLYISVALSLLTLSCTRDTYVLNTPNPTFFEKKGEVQAQIHANGKSFQPQMGASITDKVSCQLNAHLGFRGQSYLEVLGGVYYNTPKIGLEAYLGAGYGYLDYTNGVGGGFTNAESISVYANYVKVPVQLNIAFKFDDGAKFFLIGRPSFVHYSDFRYKYVSTKTDPGDYWYDVKTTQTATSIPSTGLVLDFGIGVKAHRWMFQAGGSYSWLSISQHEMKTTHSGQYIYYDRTVEAKPYYLPIYFTVGYSIGGGETSEGSSKKMPKTKRGKEVYDGQDIQ